MTVKVGDILFLDTNVLLTATDESRSWHEHAGAVLSDAGRKGVHLAVSGQIAREYLAVATRPPDVNGLGLDSIDALSNVAAFLKRTVLYGETEGVARRLCQLVREYSLRGKRIHDANVVATMLVHGLDTLVTQNPDDFAPFQGIEVVSIVDAARALASLDT